MKVVPGVRKKNKDGDSIPRGAPGIHLPNWAQVSSKYGWISLATWGRSDHWDVLGQRIPKSQAEFSLSSFLSRCCLVYWHLPGTHTMPTPPQSQPPWNELLSSREMYLWRQTASKRTHQTRANIPRLQRDRTMLPNITTMQTHFQVPLQIAK